MEELDSQYQQVIQLRRQHFDRTMSSLQLSSSLGGRQVEGDAHNSKEEMLLPSSVTVMNNLKQLKQQCAMIITSRKDQLKQQSDKLESRHQPQLSLMTYKESQAAG